MKVVGDFNGDGKGEILVSNSDKIGILELRGNTLASICTAYTGDQLGGWILDSKANKMSTVGDTMAMAKPNFSSRATGGWAS